MNTEDKILVTSPLLPNLEELNELMKDIWQRKWITNAGHYHEVLEAELAKYLGVEYISLFTNGTLPLITALQALGLTKGEVITTPYSFVATSHSIWWNQLTPVFVDIEEETCGMDPSKIEAAITENTVAIMPVHCYGKPCKTEQIDAIAKKHGLKVIYDAAHAFGVNVNGQSILNAGDISTLSFHATKVYNTIEGGALVCHSKEMKEQIDHLKNFGFLMDADGRWSLAPFYDFTRADGPNGWQTLSVAGEGANPGEKDLMRLAAETGVSVSDAEEVISAVLSAAKHLKADISPICGDAYR